MRLGRDGIAGLIGLAVSLVLLPLSFGLPKLPIVPIGPGFYPAIVLTFLAVASAALVIEDIFARRRAATDAVPAGPVAGARRSYALVAAAFAVVLAYVLLLPQLGFRISTALFVAGFQFVLERPTTPARWLVLVALAVGTALATFVVFESYLSVLLPRGRWTDW
jgi:hypothetical protein